MTVPDEGLAPPSPPPRRPPSIPRDPGVSKGIVKDSLKWTKEATASAGGTRRGGSSDAPSFVQAGADPLKPISPEFEKVFTGSPLAAAWAMLNSIQNPVTWATDTYQTYKNDAAQKAFIDQYGPTLDRMASDLKSVTLRLNDLAQQLRDAVPKLDTSKAEGIYGQKHHVGERALADIDSAYEGASPEDRNRLDNMKAELTAWMKDRDARLAAEQTDMRDLAASIGSAQREARLQSERIDKLTDQVMSASMGKQLSPQEWAFAAALRTYLQTSGWGMDRAIQAGAK
ncbi:MAG TPA: hypothetical protein VK461_08860 [Acidimicrobiales bacterium]|nr:hypothetical protein [Acidimicrobiales bacterium]